MSEFDSALTSNDGLFFLILGANEEAPYKTHFLEN